MEIHGNKWKTTETYGDPWNGNPWKSREVHGFNGNLIVGAGIGCENCDGTQETPNTAAVLARGSARERDTHPTTAS